MRTILDSNCHRSGRAPGGVAAALLVAAVGPLLTSCGFYHATTPAGIACVDIPLVPRGGDTRMYTRRRAVHTSPRPDLTASERKEALRKLACNDGADAVIEIQQEAVALPTGGGSTTVLTGFTAKWKGGAIR